MAGALQSHAQGTLMAGAGSGLAPRFDFGAVGQVLSQASHVLVVYFLNMINAESAYFAARDVAVAPPASRPARTGAVAERPTAATATSTAKARTRVRVLSTLSTARARRVATSLGLGLGLGAFLWRLRSRLGGLGLFSLVGSYIVVCLIGHLLS